MAFDSTPPRSNLIFLFSLLSVFSLLVIKFALDSYFDTEFVGERSRKAERYPSASLRTVRAQQDKLLHDGPLPIDRAVGLLADRGRRVSQMIEPQRSDDLGAMQGWKELQTSAAAGVPPGEQRPAN